MSCKHPLLPWGPKMKLFPQVDFEEVLPPDISQDEAFVLGEGGGVLNIPTWKPKHPHLRNGWKW